MMDSVDCRKCQVCHLSPFLRDVIGGMTPDQVLALAEELERRALALRRHLGQRRGLSLDPRLN
jgi:hypothetical protein